MRPSYLNLALESLLKKKEDLLAMLSRCNLCLRSCGVDRIKDERGECQTGRKPIVSSYGPHFGEEPVLVGRYGSGTIFFSGCNLKCKFCQNYQISQLVMGRELTASELATIMCDLQKMGCHNINLVSPTHVSPQIVEALVIAIREGLSLPIVYNTGGYDSLRTLHILDSIVDIYMPDAKYGDDRIGEILSGIRNYWQVNKRALIEMHQQVGDLVVKDGIAQRGLLIRHLVLPGGLAQSETVLRFIAEEISRESYVNIMDQYRPCYLADQDPGLARRLTREEFMKVVNFARSIGLHRGL
ncbi:MAG TPA: radical SAM protein [bacterium (Candidatus Stahlbacteria)]|nr:radical SAM protein [Candidatus Stahlbacteria bacterium]